MGPEGIGHEYYRRPHGSEEESSFELLPDVMTKEQFAELDREQEFFLEEVSELFPIDPGDEELKRFTSDHLDKRFKKGDRQFAAAGRPLSAIHKTPLVRLQQDYRLGNTNTCAERLLLDAADQEGVVLGDMNVYRGENVEVVDGKMRTIQERGGTRDKDKKNVMRHMVAPCAYCREGLCHHNPNAMVIMPPGILGVGENTIKLPAFMTYPEDNLFRKDDPLRAEFVQKGLVNLLQARKMQKEYFKKVAKKFPLQEQDKALVTNAYQDLQRTPLTEDPYVLIRARTITDEVIEEGGEIEPPPKRYRYLDYKRNDVELRFVDEVLEVPRLPTDTERRGSSQALHVFLEFYREPGSYNSRLMLPNADTRQRMIERFRRSFFLMTLDDEVVKLPVLTLYPNRYKRFDKGSGRV